MKRQSLYFQAPGQVEVREEELPPAQPGQVLVKTFLSAVSPGTEMLFYRGQAPAGMALDSSLSGMQAAIRYPLAYGYCCVGQVTEVEAGGPAGWLGRRVFAFQPHASHFWANPGELIALPADLPWERALFLPNLETAVNFVQDGRPLVGETVAVFGLGIVGLLTTALLAQFPLGSLLGIDPSPARRMAGLAAGLSAAVDPAHAGAWLEAEVSAAPEGRAAGMDLCFELSGAPPALDQALSLAGYAARVVIGSWYGSKAVPLQLGGAFHRSRIQLIASQVSTIAPELAGRWSKARRFAEVFRQLGRIRPERWISTRLPLARAGELYRQLDQDPGEIIQPVFTY